MIRFKKFLLEMPQLMPNWDKSEKRLKNLDADTIDGGRVISTHEPTGHKIYQSKHHETGYTYYHAVSPKDNKIDMYIKGSHNKNGFDISNLGGREGSTIKAHDMYAHLATKHGLTINSDYLQSEGGSKTWKKLSQRDDVTVSRMKVDRSDRKNPTREPVKLHLGDEWHKNYEDEKTINGPSGVPIKGNIYTHFTLKAKSPS